MEGVGKSMDGIVDSMAWAMGPVMALAMITLVVMALVALAMIRAALA